MSTAITFSRYGEPDVLTPAQVDIPEPGRGQVRIRVRAIGVNPIDVKIRSGRMDGVMPVEFPVIPGWDVAGVVDTAGEDTGAAVGDEVFGAASVGGYSEYAVLEQPAAKPKALSWEVAAGLVTAGEAAFRALKHLGVQGGQTLLIHGAGGSVGMIAVQLAASRGITVVGTVGEDDVERVGGLGATAVPYGPGWLERVMAAAPEGVDFVFDASGAGVLADSITLVGGADRVITIADDDFAKYGVRFTGMDPADRFFPESLPELAELAATGQLSVSIAATYPLTAAVQAHADIEAHRNKGKIILEP